MRRPGGRRACGLLLSALVALASGCDRPPQGPQAATAEAVQRLHDACVTAMLKDTCRVSNDRSSGSALPPAETVFVAGIGPVDAQAYRAIRASGDAMCATVRQSCLAEWEGAQCRTARGLWPASER